MRTYDLFHDLQRRYNLSVETVLYVGANHGQELPLLRLAFPRAVVHCFEPQTDCQPALAAAAAEHPKWVRVHPVALSDQTGTAVR